MRYVILIHSNPRSRELWASFSDELRAEGMAAYGAIVERLAASGELVVTEALADPSTAWRSEMVDASATMGDGPYPEAKEHLAGFFLLECESMDRAIEIANGFPEAPLGLIEVRPVLRFDPGEL